MESMFRLIKFLIALPVLVGGALIVLYFLPAHTKEWTLSKLSGIVPEKIHEKTEELLLTPPEERAKLISKLETQFGKLKSGVSTTTARIVDETEALITKLKAKNEDESLPTIAARKLVDTILGREKATSTPPRCVPQNQ